MHAIEVNVIRPHCFSPARAPESSSLASLSLYWRTQCRPIFYSPFPTTWPPPSGKALGWTSTSPSPKSPLSQPYIHPYLLILLQDVLKFLDLLLHPMVDIDVHGVLKLIRWLILHCFWLVLPAALQAILLARVEPHELCDEGIIGIVVKLIVDPLVGGRGRELLHEDVPVIKIRVDAAVRIALIKEAVRLMASRVRKTRPSA